MLDPVITFGLAVSVAKLLDYFTRVKANRRLRDSASACDILHEQAVGSRKCGQGITTPAVDIAEEVETEEVDVGDVDAVDVSAEEVGAEDIDAEETDPQEGESIKDKVQKANTASSRIIADHANLAAGRAFTEEVTSLPKPCQSPSRVIDADRAIRSGVENIALVTLPAQHAPVARAQPDIKGSAKHSWRTCVILMILCGATVLASLSLALWWSMAHDDVSGGFTMAGYIVTASGILLYPIQYRHSKNCECWNQPGQSHTE